MVELTYLSPAETLFVQAPKEVKAEELARVTFLDLVLRKVLKLEVIKLKQIEQQQVFDEIVSRGENFCFYHPKKHEELFVAPFSTDDSLKINLRNLIKIAFQNISTTNEYKLKYVYNEQIAKYFSANFFQRLFGIKKINKQGRQFQAKLNQYLNGIKINATSDDEWKMVEEKLLSLRGNILLIPNIDSKIFKRLHHTYKHDKKQKKEQDHDDFLYDYTPLFIYDNQNFISNFYLTEAMTATFEETIDSIETFDAPSDSFDGGNSDGGDGGCSGCGGCGGCG